MSLKQIKAFFDAYDFPEKEVRLDQATVIKDPRKYVEAQIKILESQSGKKWALPYYERLNKLYNKIKTD